MIEFLSFNKEKDIYKKVNNGDFFSSCLFLNSMKSSKLKTDGLLVKLHCFIKWEFVCYKDDKRTIVFPFFKENKEIIIPIDLFDFDSYCTTFEDNESHFKIVNEMIMSIKNKYNLPVVVQYIYKGTKEDIEKYFDTKFIYQKEAVKIDISNGYEEWKKDLSKSSRQNQRTAYNRLEKDEKIYEITNFYGNITKKVLFKEIYSYRKRNIERRCGKYTFFFVPLIAIAAKLDMNNNPWVKSIIKSDSSYSAVLTINGKIAASLAGIIWNKRFVIPYLSYNTKFGRYDPGRILINESIKYLTENNLSSCFDLYLGIEKYKFDNGGEKYLYYYIKM